MDRLTEKLGLLLQNFDEHTRIHERASWRLLALVAFVLRVAMILSTTSRCICTGSR